MLRRPEEAVEQLAVRVAQREVLLVLLHRQDQALLRARRGSPRSNPDVVDDRPLDERRDLVEQLVRHHGLAAGLRRSRQTSARISRAALPEEAITLPSRASCVFVGVGGLDQRSRRLPSKRWPWSSPRVQSERVHRDHLVRRAARPAGARAARTARWSCRRRAGSSSPWGSAAPRAPPRAPSAAPRSSCPAVDARR